MSLISYKEKISSFNLIYRSAFSDILLQSNQGYSSITHAPVLSNLKVLWLFVESDAIVYLAWSVPG